MNLFIRFFDIVCSFLGLVFLSPLMLFLSLLIIFDSRGGVFFTQLRVGKDGKDFRLFKFRTMVTDSERSGLLSVGKIDVRVTRAGVLLRKYKLDELPQLLNVLIGDMSIVGPRPEVRKYVNLYTPDQKKVLKVKPGITDLASIEFADENTILGKSANPEQTYIYDIMPKKIELNMIYVENQSVYMYFKLILTTIFRILR